MTESTGHSCGCNNCGAPLPSADALSKCTFCGTDHKIVTKTVTTQSDLFKNKWVWVAVVACALIIPALMSRKRGVSKTIERDLNRLEQKKLAKT